MRTEVITLTPEIAQQLISKNIDNRPLSRATLEKYASSIKRGEWQLNGEPIIVFSDGGLGDGQHRCHAVIKSGKPIKTLVVYDVPREAFKTIDSGKGRGAPDVLSIQGYKNTNNLAAAARAYMAYHLTLTEERQITATQILQTVEQKPHIRYWATKHCGFERRIFPMFFSGLVAVASERYGIEKMELFFDACMTGLGLEKASPMYLLRERFINQTGTKQMSVKIQKALVIKAMNAYLLGKPLNILRFIDGVEEMPKII